MANQVKQDNQVNPGLSKSGLCVITSPPKPPTPTGGANKKRNAKNLSLQVPVFMRPYHSAPNTPPPPLEAGPAPESPLPKSIPPRLVEPPPFLLHSEEEFNKPLHLGTPRASTFSGVGTQPSSWWWKDPSDGGDDGLGEDPYRDQPVEILHNLYLGTEINAANRELLSKLNIRYVLNVAKEVKIPWNKDQLITSPFAPAPTSPSAALVAPSSALVAAPVVSPVTATAARFGSVSSVGTVGVGTVERSIGGVGSGNSSIPALVSPPLRSPGLFSSFFSLYKSTTMPINPSTGSASGATVGGGGGGNATISATVGTATVGSGGGVKSWLKPSKYYPKLRSPVEAKTFFTQTMPSLAPSTTTSQKIPMTKGGGEEEEGKLRYKKFPWGHNQENLQDYFHSAFSFIDEGRDQNYGVLVHCQLGVSRSASMMLAYVMRTLRLPLHEAYAYVKSKSSVISPNMSLIYQLVEFEKTLNLPERTGRDGARELGEEEGLDLASSFGGRSTDNEDDRTDEDEDCPPRIRRRSFSGRGF